MSQRDRNRVRDAEQRIADDKPVVEPKLLKTFCQMNLPLRGPFRNEVMLSVTQQVAERRRASNLSSRAVSEIVGPISRAVQSQAENRMQRRVQGTMQEVVEESEAEDIQKPISIGPGILLGGED